MNFTEAEYGDAFRQSFPDVVLRAILLAVIDGYRATPAACKKVVDRPEQHDAFGTLRRAKVYEQLRGVGELHKLEYLNEPNSIGSTFFMSIFSGEFRLAAHLVGRRKNMVRPANIRKAWAAHNHDGRNHKFEFADSPKSPLPNGSRFVAFLIHGPRGRHRDQPAFVDIVIPDNNFRDYIYTLSLFKMFPQIANGVTGSREQTRKLPKPKRNRKDGKEGVA